MVPPQTGGLAWPQPPAPIPPLLIFSSMMGQVWDHVPGIPSKLLCRGVGGWNTNLPLTQKVKHIM